MTTCVCPETDCTNAKHPAGKPCSSTPVTIHQREVLAGWQGGRCPGCLPQVVAAVRHGEAASKRVLEQVFGPDYEPKRRKRR